MVTSVQTENVKVSQEKLTLTFVEKSQSVAALYCAAAIVSETALKAISLSAQFYLTVKVPMMIACVAIDVIFNSNKEQEEGKSEAALSKNHTFYDSVFRAPIIEEILFRGIIQPICGRTVAAVTFGCAHFGNVNGKFRLPNLLQVISSGMSGYYLLGPICAQYGLMYSMLAHSLNNYFAENLTYFLSPQKESQE